MANYRKSVTVLFVSKSIVAIPVRLSVRSAHLVNARLSSLSDERKKKKDDFTEDDERFKCSKPLLLLNRAKPITFRPVSLTDCHQIASYNWRRSLRTPCIIIPGAPKEYIPWKGGQLVPDASLRKENFVDENHYLLPRYPVDPLFYAVDYCHRTETGGQPCNFQKYDIVTDRNNLRKLFSYCCDSDTNAILDGFSTFSRFRIDVQRIGNVIVLIRRDRVDTETSVRHRFGADFERRNTNIIHPNVRGSYRQIVEYKFGPAKGGKLNMLVRFMADCADYEMSTPLKRSPLLSVDVIPKSYVCPETNLKIVQWGRRQNYYLMELMTRYSHRNFNETVWTQLYFSCTPSLVLGIHNDGYCSNIVRFPERHAHEDIAPQFEQNMATELMQFYNLLKTLVHCIRDFSEKRTFTILYDASKSSNLELHEVFDTDRFAASEYVKGIATKTDL